MLVSNINNNNNNNKSSSANIVAVTYNKKPPVPVIIATTKVKKDVKTAKQQQKNRQTNEISSAKSSTSVSKLNKYISNDTKAQNDSNSMLKFHSNSLPSFPKIEGSVKSESDYVNTSALEITKNVIEIAPNEIEITLAINENNLNKIKSSSASSCK